MYKLSRNIELFDILNTIFKGAAYGIIVELGLIIESSNVIRSILMF